MYDFIEGQVYKRRDIHDRYGGQRQGGISTPSGHPMIFLFTGQSGTRHGYGDGWSDGVFEYFGQGQYGDMSFSRGNEAIRSHLANGRDLLLFEKLDHQGMVRFQGAFICGGFNIVQAPDSNDELRQAIVFHLIPEGAELAGANAPADAATPSRPTVHRTLAELRQRAKDAAKTPKQAQPSKTAWRAAHERSEAVKDYALARADGICERCNEKAPFETSSGLPFLEVHHLTRLSDGGPDAPDKVAAICPNCHREIHHGRGGRDINHRLADAIDAKEMVIAYS
ncbi:HNH endonuclease [Spiribacter roseus]|uniref:HNH endonuclease signature motif containing protein n=1 Tax=Spiribacter roseus TaxID=1855875 RepID=A0ABV3RV99_9GAMM